jgi:cytochrome P450
VQHRALARPFFARERTSDLELFERHSAKVLQILNDHRSRSDAVDVQNLFARFTMDTITEMLFGNCVNSLESADSLRDDYSKFISAYNAMQKIAIQRIRM